MTRDRLLVGLGLALLGLGVIAFVLLGGSDEGSAPKAAASEPTSAPADDAPARRASPDPEPAVAKPKPKLDRAASDRMREQIQRSLDSRSEAVGSRSAAPAGGRADEGELADEPPPLDADYIRERIREDLLPVAVECYESALVDNPELAGELVVNFAILGDPEVGGVVDEVEVGDESTLASEFVRECVRESMMAVNFDAPPEGGRVDVTYPLAFAPDGPPDPTPVPNQE
ncbi:AgmX/PglI C-terminal domain-containing protein [Nannocystaceae bacterium ST9]